MMKKNRFFKILGVGALTFVLSIGQMLPSFAAITPGTWKYESNAWKFYNEAGATLTGWVETATGWYYLNIDGTMKTGWFQDIDGSWYFLDTRAGDTNGRMLTGWQRIDGYLYYMQETLQENYGKLFVSGTLPGGYSADGNGRLTNASGNIEYVAGEGISSQPTLNTTKSTKTTTRAGGGSSSGGSRSSGGGGGSSRKRSGSTLSGSNTIKTSTIASTTPTTENGMRIEEAIVEDNELVYSDYTKFIDLGWAAYVVATFKQGNAKNYRIYIDDVEVTDHVSAVDDAGYIIKWQSTVVSPKELKVVHKTTNKEQIVSLNTAGEKETITKLSASSPAYILTNGPVYVWDYYLETFDKNGNIRKVPSTTTFDITGQREALQTGTSVPTQYYIEDTAINNDTGKGEIVIKLLLENEAQIAWFNQLTTLKAMDASYQYSILNSKLTYSTQMDPVYTNTGIIKIPLPQTNFRSRGRFYVNITSTYNASTLTLPVHLVDDADFKIQLHADTPNPKVGERVMFNIIHTDGNRTFGNDLVSPVYKVTLLKPDGTSVSLTNIYEWSLIGSLFSIYGSRTDTTTGVTSILTDQAGIYSVTIYANGYKTMTKKFEVLNVDGTYSTSASTTNASTSTSTTDATSSASRSTSNGDSYSARISTDDALIIANSLRGAGASYTFSMDAVSGASSSSSSSTTDATSSASASSMMNAYLLFDHDLLMNALILNQLGLRNSAATAVIEKYFDQSTEAAIGTNMETVYMLDDFLDFVRTGRIEEGKQYDWKDYIQSVSIRTRTIPGQIKRVLEDGNLGTTFRYAEMVGDAAPIFSGTTIANGSYFTITVDDPNYFAAITNLYIDGNSTTLRSDDYLRQYSLSEEKTKLYIYESAFNKYTKSYVGNHTLKIYATGYETITLALTITDTLEAVKLLADSGKADGAYYTNESVDISISSPDTDTKKGDFISKIESVSLRYPDGTIKSILTAVQAGDSDTNYEIDDETMTLGAGLFSTKGVYTLYINADGYSVKSVTFSIVDKEVDTSSTSVISSDEGELAPTVMKSEKVSTIFSFDDPYIRISFSTADLTLLKAYLEAAREDSSVTVNGTSYKKVTYTGTKSTYAISMNDGYGRYEYITLGLDAMTLDVNTVVITVDGYETVTLYIKKDGTLSSTSASTKSTKTSTTENRALDVLATDSEASEIIIKE